jgi:diguanylate cyclase (GGDEF)-like protein
MHIWSDNMGNMEYIKDNDVIISGNAMFDQQFYSIYANETLSKYFGINCRKRLYEIADVSEQEVVHQTFLKAFQTGEKQTCYAKLQRADQEYRLCRITIRYTNNEKYDVQIIDVENACAACFYNLYEIEKLRYLAEKQNFIIFEYYYDTHKTEIYYYDENSKVNQATDDTYKRLRRYITRDALKVTEQLTPFKFRKEYKVAGIKYIVNGNVILENSKKSEIIGMIVESDKFTAPKMGASNIHDPATGLYNKPHSLMLARKAIELKKYAQVSIVMLDIDNFKEVNDTYGHLFGDEVLKKFALILREAAMNRGFAGRFGGDEFFMCLYNIGTEKDLRSLLQDIYYKFLMAFDVKNLNLTCSMGIAEYPRNSVNYDILLKKADRALYIAKYKGKKRYIIYKEELHGEIEEDDTLGNVVKKEITTRDQLHAELKECFVDLMQVTGNIIVVTQIVNQVIELYKITGISVYDGKYYRKLYEFGTYTSAMKNVYYLDNVKVRSMFSDDGLLAVKIDAARGIYIEELHGELKKHHIDNSLQCIIGDRDNIKALITFDCEKEQYSWSEEEKSMVMIFCNMLAVALQII